MLISNSPGLRAIAALNAEPSCDHRRTGSAEPVRVSTSPQPLLRAGQKREAMAAPPHSTEAARWQSARKCGTAVGRVAHRAIVRPPRNHGTELDAWSVLQHATGAPAVMQCLDVPIS